MYKMLRRYISVLLFAVLILSGCNPWPNPFASNPFVSSPKIDKVIKSGKFVEDVELQVFPVFNCQSQVQNTVNVSRSRTLEQSVHFNIDPSIKFTSPDLESEYIKQIDVTIGGEYGWTNGTTITDSGGLLLNAAPQSYPVYTVAWRQHWEQGYVEVETQSGTEQVPYEFLSEAHPEINNVSYVECNSSGFSTATAIALSLNSNSTPTPTLSPTQFPTIVQPTLLPTPTTVSESTIYDDFNNPLFNGSYDRSKWSITEDYQGACNVSQQNGHLTFTHTPSSSLSGCFINGSFDGVGGNMFQSFQAKIFISNDFRGTCCGYLGLTLSSNSFSGGGGWIECSLQPQPGMVAGVFAIKHGAGTYEYFSQLKTTFDAWHTIRLQIDQSNYAVSCYMDNNLIGSTIPKDASLLREANFSRYLAAGWPENSTDTYELDDVATSP